EDLDDQGVPGARVANLHGAGERMATERATAQDVLVGGRLRVEAVGGIASLEDDAVAGVDREPRLQRVVPLLMDHVVIEVVGLHPASPFQATMPVPERHATAGM